QTKEQAATNPILAMDVVDVRHFETLGMPIRRGRAFSPADGPGQPRVVILSESAARYFWPGEDPIGKRLLEGTDKVTGIGIVPDSRYRDLRQPRRAIYYPLS